MSEQGQSHPKTQNSHISGLVLYWATQVDRLGRQIITLATLRSYLHGNVLPYITAQNDKYHKKAQFVVLIANHKSYNTLTISIACKGTQEK